MQKITGSLVTIGLTALAMPVAAQDFYAGFALGSGDFNAFENDRDYVESEIESFSVFGGVRFDVARGFYAGVEVQASNANGFVEGRGRYPFRENEVSSYQGELHLGYNYNDILFYGFAGIGSHDFDDSNPDLSLGNSFVRGLGVEIPVYQNLSARVEGQLTDLSLEDSCCGTYDIEMSEVSLGLVYNF